MSVGIQVGSIVDEIGASDFFTSFFNTIAVKLEMGEWGSRYPTIMRDLYSGEIDSSKSDRAIEELNSIFDGLSGLDRTEIVWDLDDRSKSPPWGDNIADTITNMSNYFVTSTGYDLIETLKDAFVDLRESGGKASIVQV